MENLAALAIASSEAMQVDPAEGGRRRGPWRTILRRAWNLALFSSFSQFLGQILSIEPLVSFLLRYLTSRYRRRVKITISGKSSRWELPDLLYNSAETYLASLAATRGRFLRGRLNGYTRVVLSMDNGDRIADTFRGLPVEWTYRSERVPVEGDPYREKTSYTLTFHEAHRREVLDDYLRHVVRTSEGIDAMNRKKKLHTNTLDDDEEWTQVVFRHPATFDTIGLDPALKKMIIDDLLAFKSSEDYYKKIGKAWKRGYLLYGPPGTGKSTMIAAIANFMNYDIYDVELTSVKNNSSLRKLIAKTSSKSVIVIEDIDCSVDLTADRAGKEGGSKKKGKKENGSEEDSKITLSGLLNFIDGLWSAGVGERIFIFTTNYVDRLDSALIRAGRMDLHIELSYCRMGAFKVLVKNYLGIDEHPLFGRAERLLEEVDMTPASVVEKLMPKKVVKEEGVDEATACLVDLIGALEGESRRKKEEAGDSKDTVGGDWKPGAEEGQNESKIIGDMDDQKPAAAA